jgi:hypothetical protein
MLRHHSEQPQRSRAFKITLKFLAVTGVPKIKVEKGVLEWHRHYVFVVSSSHKRPKRRAYCLSSRRSQDWEIAYLKGEAWVS